MSDIIKFTSRSQLTKVEKIFLAELKKRCMSHKATTKKINKKQNTTIQLSNNPEKTSYLPGT